VGLALETTFTPLLIPEMLRVELLWV